MMSLSPNNELKSQVTGAKRMRLGTKSCSECRRRKVRCDFEPGEKICQNCKIHETGCRPQQAKASRSDKKESPNSTVEGRLKRLELAIRNFNSQGTAKESSKSTDPSQFTSEQALDVLKVSDTVVAQIGNSDESNEALRAYEVHCENSPLFGLLNKVMNIQNIAQPQPEQSTSTDDPKTIRLAMKALVPGPDELTRIFEHTQPLWSLWWPVPLPHLSDADTRGDSQHTIAVKARDFTLESIQSSDSLKVARAVSWLALCLQQCAPNLEELELRLAGSIDVLMGCFVRGIKILLTAAEGSGDRTLGTECLMLYAKLCINLGRPMHAWLATRRAVNSALLHALHRSRPFSTEHNLWYQAWHTDRLMSCIGGMPSCVPEAYLKPPSELSEQPIPLRTMYLLSLIAGRIGERNYAGEDADYSDTLKIEQDLMNCRNDIPDEWWEFTPASDISFADLYTRTSVKLIYYQLHKMIHMPYMMKEAADVRFQQSRLSCLSACRNMITTYNVLRLHGQTTCMMCDLMDYQVFSAGMVILISFLSGHTDRDSHQGLKDWDMLQTLISRLRALSRVTECATASQATKILEYASLASQGQYAGIKPFEAAIPEFGRIRISNVKARSQSKQIKTTTSETSDIMTPSTSPSTMTNTVEVSTNYFLPIETNYFGKDPFGNDELSADWTDLMDTDASYDFTQLFNTTFTGF